MYRETASGGRGCRRLCGRHGRVRLCRPHTACSGSCAAERPVRHAAGTPLPPLALFAWASQPAPALRPGKAAAAPKGARVSAPSGSSWRRSWISARKMP